VDEVKQAIFAELATLQGSIGRIEAGARTAFDAGLAELNGAAVFLGSLTQWASFFREIADRYEVDLAADLAKAKGG
jgi:hypothetical protein